MKEPTAEEVRGWREQSVGQYFEDMLKQKMEDLKDGWANGGFTGENAEMTIQLNSEAIGKVQQIADILIDLEEMSTDERTTESTEY